mmetsp:Transcript_84281/g.238857  ORF Transcript_84281/g.238857 Transcript_84281/m.238857 type:complete len:995 (-) Transcript_84281:68-3052(-)
MALLAVVRVQARVCSGRLHRCAAFRGALQLQPLAPSCRRFAGRSSRGGDGERQPEPTEVGAEPARDVAGQEAAQEGATPAAVAGDASKPEASGAGAPALFALPLYRKPAFPGFYQIVQVSEQEVLDFLFSLRKSGQGEYLGGFMTTELPSKVAESDPEPVAAGAPPSQAQGLRRDAGRVASVAELEEVGTVLQVINLTQYPNISGGQVVVMPRRRVRRTRVVSAPSPNVALAAVGVDYLNEPEVPQGDENVKALHLEIIATMKELLKTSFLYKEQFEQVIRFYDLDQPLKLADLVAGMSLAQRQELQAVLVENNIVERLRKVLMIVKKDLEFARLQSHVKSQVEEKVTKEQRRMMLMEQMKQITKELGIEKDEKSSLITQFREAIKDKTLTEEASKVIEHEIQKLGTIEPSSSEYNVCRTYLEWLTVLPWGYNTPENKDIAKAEGILNEDHYGLEDVKERILEHIAVSFLKESVQGKIMCLVGPPGVGKTSVGKSIARALERKFYRFSVGGMHDVAEIRGHRRTYVGAMPGKLIQCLKITQSSNPVVLIDEIDKLGRDYRGDPSSALLEILDPEQNSTFRDHYLDVPVDLSRVLFVCTANVTDTIPGPLLDRMEVIRIAGYVFEEKVAIANQFLIPQTEEQSGIGADRLELQTEALHKMITDYAREAGVRQLRKLLEKVTRKVALSVVRKPDDNESKKAITVDNLTEYIGQPLHMSDRLFASNLPAGVVMGLAWTSMGGASLFIEARGRLPRKGARQGAEEPGADGPDSSASESGSGGSLMGSMQVTGQLGSVMNESSAVSLTYARLFVQELDPGNSFLDDARIHLNVPEGAVPKDGPSAGVTMASALVSLALDRPVRADVAMTGELTLSGKVLKVGGIKEKVIAARREGVSTLLLPRQNEADFTELKDYLRAGFTAHFIDHFDDVYRFAFDESQVLPLPGPPRGLPVVSVHAPLTPAPGEAGSEQSADVPPVNVPAVPLQGPSAAAGAGASRM